MGAQQSAQQEQSPSPSSSIDASTIQSLDYSNQKLKSLEGVKLPEHVLKHIISLNLNTNELETIVGISKVVNVEELDLSFNALKILQEEVFTLARLRKLKLSNCKLADLSPKIANLKR
jgi:Leucine-rich repeat (LRR) protein